MKLKILSPQIIDHLTSASDLLSLLATNRHLSASDLPEFINPPLPQFKVPKLKISKTDNILIYGDYDVDGLTSTAILWQALYRAGYQVTPFVPHRQIDGYGFKSASFFRFQQEKKVIFNCLITIDNGIVASSEFVKLLSKQPAKIIVIDHHLPADTPPPVDQIIHSTSMCAASLSYFVAKNYDPQADLGLAALGTVADCLPLLGINRSLVVHGLQSLRLNPSPGIKKIIEIARIKADSISAYDLGFIIAPRLNASGRLDSAFDSLRLLCSATPAQATKYAQSITKYNQDRQLLQKESLDQVESMISKNESGVHPTSKLIFVSGDYNPGIIGLIAGRLTQKYYLPSIIISNQGDIAKGSCRSIAQLNIIDKLRQCSDLFIDLGGHPGAAGFSILSKNIPKLQKKITKIIDKQLKNLSLEPTLEVDAQILPSAVNLPNINTIATLAPFGIGNPQPQFLLRDLVVTGTRVLGATGDHLKITFGHLDAVYFKKGELAGTIHIGDHLDLVAQITINTWNSRTTPQLIIQEICQPNTSDL